MSIEFRSVRIGMSFYPAVVVLGPGHQSIIAQSHAGLPAWHPAPSVSKLINLTH